MYINIHDLLWTYGRDLSDVFTLVGEDVDAMITDDDLVLQTNSKCFDRFYPEWTCIDLMQQVSGAMINDQERVIIAD